VTERELSRALSAAEDENARIRAELDEARLALQARLNEQPLVGEIQAQLAAAQARAEEADRERDAIDRMKMQWETRAGTAERRTEALREALEEVWDRFAIHSSCPPGETSHLRANVHERETMERVAEVLISAGRLKRVTTGAPGWCERMVPADRPAESERGRAREDRLRALGFSDERPAPLVGGVSLEDDEEADRE
jgi:multidrug efflux pump subunit AcrA (membrane-fusion protein)